MVTKSRFLYMSLLLIILLQSNRVFGATGDTTQIQQTIEPFKRWSLNFHMDEDFSWDQANGNLVSGQYFFKSDLAFRFGVGGEYSYYTLERDRVRPDNKPTSKMISVDLYPTLLFYQKSVPFKFYWGLGPVLGLEFNEDKTEQRENGGAWQLMQKTETESYNLGLQGIVGAEWRFRNWLFLFMEYNPQLIFRYHQVEDMRTGRHSAQTITLYSNPIGLGIGILF
jgi:hypothetical protein